MGVECSIEDGDLSHAGHDLFNRFDPLQACWIMERSEGGKALNIGLRPG